MKLLITSSMIFALSLVACQKEENLASPGTPVVGQTKTTKYRVLYHNTEYNLYLCANTNGNCLPDAIVLRLHQPAMNSVMNAVRSGVHVDIVSAFTTNRSMLLNYVDEKDIDYVIDGTYNASAGQGDHDCQFLFVHDAQNNLISAYPMYNE